MGIENGRNEPLINRKESDELRSGIIDRVNDGEKNSSADLMEFLNEQRDQAIVMLNEKAKKIFEADDSEDGRSLSVNEQKILTEAINAVNRLVENQEILSMVIVSTICAKMSDIVGFDLSIDDNNTDQFGKKKRISGHEMKATTGFFSYSREQMTGAYKVPSRLDLEVRRYEMTKFDAKKNDIDEVMEGLNKHGDAKYEKFAKKGPVLVFLPEIHTETSLMQDDFNAIVELQHLIAVLSTEQMEGELKTEHDRTYSKSQMNNLFKAIGRIYIPKGSFSSSSQAAELLLADDIFTYGVENEVLLTEVLIDVEKKNGKIMIGRNITNRNFIEKSIKNMKKDKFLEEIVNKYRNQLWLRNTQALFLNPKTRDQFSSDSNIVFMVGGAAHMEDIKNNAGNWGFKGFISFEPESYDDKYKETNKSRR